MDQFRFGHTLVNDEFMRTVSRERPRKQKKRRTFNLADAFFDDEMVGGFKGRS